MFLKVRDDIDLKELKKYGFTIKYDVYTGKIAYCRYENKTHLVNHYFEINIDVNTRRLEIRSYSTASFENRHSEIEEVVENLLYDLTKANLLEKIRKEERHDDK